jgi:hypothetical protein
MHVFFLQLLDHQPTPTSASYIFSPASRSVTVNGADVTGKNFTGIKSWSISGVVVNPFLSGNCVGVTITLSNGASKTTTTDVNCKYSFTNLINGSYIVTPTKADHVFLPYLILQRSFWIYSPLIKGVRGLLSLFSLYSSAQPPLSPFSKGELYCLSDNNTVLPEKFAVVLISVTINDADVTEQNFFQY